MPTRITENVLAKMRAGQVVRDDVVRGFYVRMGARGRASYEVRREGASPFFRVIGTSDLMSPSKARQLAKDLLAQHTLDRHGPKRGKFTIDSAEPIHHAELRRRNRSANTIGYYKDGLKRLGPEIRKKPLRELAESPELLLKEWERIRKDNGNVAADATARSLRTLYLYVKKRHDHSLPAQTPTVDLDLTVRKSEHPLKSMAPGDLQKWWRDIQATQSPLRAQAYLFCLMSGLRKNELLNMEWAHIEPDPLFCHIPRPKGGPRRAFDLILSKPMRDILDVVLALGKELAEAGGLKEWKWVWPNPETRSGHLINMHRGVRYTPHALRRTYSGIGEVCKVDAESIERFLNHNPKFPLRKHYVLTTTVGGTLVEAQERISQFILDGINGKLPDYFA